jgi:hypothetical protein
MQIPHTTINITMHKVDQALVDEARSDHQYHPIGEGWYMADTRPTSRLILFLLFQDGKWYEGGCSYYSERTEMDKLINIIEA